ncbi:uncharacterized protein LOC103958924 isoform X2 [Pyrus x bretschneideri]|uniref:uncharacterized protein LOC103958924 isoform X2 n=1 Tax=Pyrus x bretschneideri TaxID=225117 RepID=UPI00202FBA99|nr:uncharacterized protein LOC103958924 isoform X2 [Pyrus x bretschneideri]
METSRLQMTQFFFKAYTSPKYHSYKLSLYVSPREIPWKHHACKRSYCRPTHKQTPSESRRIQRDALGAAAAASSETSPQNHHHSLRSTQDTQAKAFHCAVSSKMSGLAVTGYRVLASGRSNGAFRKHWSSNFGAVVCSIGSPFVLRETMLFVFWNRLQSARLEDLKPKVKDCICFGIYKRILQVIYLGC